MRGKKNQAAPSRSPTECHQCPSQGCLIPRPPRLGNVRDQINQCRAVIIERRSQQKLIRGIQAESFLEKFEVAFRAQGSAGEDERILLGIEGVL